MRYSKTRLTAFLSIAALTVATSASLVIADTKTKTDPKGDTKGKADSGFDLKSATAGHAGDKVVHTVVSWTKAGPGGVVLELDVGRNPGPDFAVYRSRDTGKVQVVDAKTGKKVAAATYKKISGTSFKLVFSLGFDGNPDYKWRWRVYGQNGTYDLLPNKGWVSHGM